MGEPFPGATCGKCHPEFNHGGKVLAEERGVVAAKGWFPKAEGELAEEVIGLGRYREDSYGTKA